MKYHVHVYEVSKKYEIELDTIDETDALKQSLELAKQNKLKEVEKDCSFISMPYEIE